MTQGGLPIGQWSGSDATQALHETIKTFNATHDPADHVDLAAHVGDRLTDGCHGDWARSADLAGTGEVLTQ